MTDTGVLHLNEHLVGAHFVKGDGFHHKFVPWFMDDQGLRGDVSKIGHGDE